MQFIHKHEVKHDKTVTYTIFMCYYRQQKEEKEWTWITVGGDILDYQGEVPTKTARLTIINLLLNSVISSAGAIFMTADVKTIYLNTPSIDPENMCIPIKLTPNEIWDEYKIS